MCCVFGAERGLTKMGRGCAHKCEAQPSWHVRGTLLLVLDFPSALVCWGGRRTNCRVGECAGSGRSWVVSIYRHMTASFLCWRWRANHTLACAVAHGRIPAEAPMRCVMREPRPSRTVPANQRHCSATGGLRMQPSVVEMHVHVRWWPAPTFRKMCPTMWASAGGTSAF